MSESASAETGGGSTGDKPKAKKVGGGATDASIDPTYTIEKWRCVTEWKYTDDSLSQCPICQNSFKEASIHYLSEPTPANDAAGGLEIQHGSCGHAFHRDCITKYLKAKSTCPLCSRVWDFTKNEPIQGADALRPK